MHHHSEAQSQGAPPPPTTLFSQKTRKEKGTRVRKRKREIIDFKLFVIVQS
jgi:hypothetical protein